ncbi:MAG: MarR family transcriptional regulator [Armatimonadetes bacterium]|nr:MarR family transcriptional regulator [Armatimonadota bacterium]
MNSSSEPEKQQLEETCPFAGESLLGSTFFLAMHALWFDEKPNPDMDALLHAAPNGTMKDFSERLFVSQSTVTQLADRLVHRGFIERHPDTHDRRVVRLKISESGRVLLVTSEASRKELVQAVWERMSVCEQEEMITHLKKLASLAETARAEMGRPLPSLLSSRKQHSDSQEEPLQSSQPKPMMDIMSRSVRGKTN